MQDLSDRMHQIISHRTHSFDILDKIELRISNRVRKKNVLHANLSKE